MDFALSENQEQFVASFSELLIAECTTQRVRASEKTGFDPQLWRRICDMGVPWIGVGEAHGGLGLGLLDLALMAEVHGRFIAPVPLIETMVAARLLVRSGRAGQDFLKAKIDDGAAIGVSLDEKGAESERLVLGGAATPLFVALRGDELLLAEMQTPSRLLKNTGSSPLAMCSIGSNTHLLAQGNEAKKLYATAVQEWKVLTAASLAGLAQGALELGVDYAKERKAFGAPIGSYQAVAHPLADAVTALDGAALLARAAAASESDRRRFHTLASMAFVFCAQTARRIADVCLHVHGGYGFILEQDIQLFVRRAKAWPLVLHDPREEFQTIAGDLFDKPEALKKWIFD